MGKSFWSANVAAACGVADGRGLAAALAAGLLLAIPRQIATPGNLAIIIVLPIGSSAKFGGLFRVRSLALFQGRAARCDSPHAK